MTFSIYQTSVNPLRQATIRKGFYDASDSADGTSGLQVDSDCTPCPPGTSCAFEANTETTTANCDDGYYWNLFKKA